MTGNWAIRDQQSVERGRRRGPKHLCVVQYWIEEIANTWGGYLLMPDSFSSERSPKFYFNETQNHHTRHHPLILTLSVSVIFSASHWLLLLSSVCKGAKADLVFLIDGSWSIGEDSFTKIMHFVSSVIGAFDVVGPSGMQVCVVGPGETWHQCPGVVCMSETLWMCSNGVELCSWLKCFPIKRLN